MTSPKNIIITGASSGLGTALALEYAENGVVLGLIGRDTTRLNAAAALCQQKGAQVVIAAIDVREAEALEQWVMEFDRNHPVDLCIANAGISAGTGGGGESPEQARRIFNVNVDGVINTLLPVAQVMKQRGKGQLAIISSIAGFRGSLTAPAYSASKAAIRVYGQALQGDLEPYGVDVSVVCPGFMRTPMTDINPFPMPFIMSVEQAARITKNAILKRKRLKSFPLPMAIIARVQNLLPDSLMNRLYRAVPSKPSN